MEAKEMISNFIKKENIKYFEYSEFSSVIVIGEGGFGIVSKARMENKGINVALKRLINGIENVNDEFIKELKLLRELDYHENINRFLGLSKDTNGNYILVLAYANEGNLSEYLKKKSGFLEWEVKIKMALDITCGLKFLHYENVIHRDLHSRNILVNNGQLLIADFGLSKKLVNTTSNSPISKANEIGMIKYLDPQCLKNDNYKKNKKSDIYSLGVILWEIASERSPFPNCQRDALKFHISNGRREEPIEGTPPEYQQLYQKCWDGDPNMRPDIEEVHNTLSRLNQINAEKPLDSDFGHDSSIKSGHSDTPDHIRNKDLEEVNNIKLYNDMIDPKTLQDDTLNETSLLTRIFKYIFKFKIVAPYRTCLSLYEIVISALIAFYVYGGIIINLGLKSVLNIYKYFYAVIKCWSGNNYFKDNGKEEKAFNSYLKSARSGHATAQFKTGFCYQIGIGTDIDKIKAFEWYLKSAKNGNPKGQLSVGNCYFDGIGTEKDLESAFKWYSKSAKNGDASGQFNKGHCYQNGIGTNIDYKKAFKWYLRSAENRNAKGQLRLGDCYLNGIGTDKDGTKAFEWYLKSAENGNELAQMNLGDCYENGIGIDKNKIKAFEWYLKSAENNNETAYLNLIIYYLFGIGTDSNELKAFEWFSKLAKNNSNMIMDYLEDLKNTRLNGNQSKIDSIIKFDKKSDISSK